MTSLDLQTLFALCPMFFLASMLYASVGHGGASAYLAIMALFAISPEVMRPTALTLNILVAGIGVWSFVRAGRFSWQVLWPVALGAAPFAYLGGSINLPTELYRTLLGIVLFAAAARLAFPGNAPTAQPLRPPHPLIGVVSGGGIGLLAGLTGTGGGIFLSPLMIFLRWTSAQASTGVAASFIVVNSIAGLAGNWAATGHLPPFLPILASTVVIGGLVGAGLGLRRFSSVMLRRALAVVMLIAGLKLVLT